LSNVQAVKALERRVLALQQLPWEERRGRSLRVVTGRGLHSAGGEASLPRVVQSFLDAQVSRQGWRYSRQLGAYQVTLGRSGASGAHSAMFREPIALGGYNSMQQR
jgi:hypothetical protein